MIHLNQTKLKKNKRMN